MRRWGGGIATLKAWFLCILQPIDMSIDIQINESSRNKAGFEQADHALWTWVHDFGRMQKW